MKYKKMSKKFCSVVVSSGLILQMSIPTVYANEKDFEQNTNTIMIASNLGETTTGSAISTGLSISEKLQTLNIGDTITINNEIYTYKDDVSSKGLNIAQAEYSTDGKHVVYKAGEGYILITWPTQTGGEYLVTLHNADIETSEDAINICGRVIMTLEENNTLKTSKNGIYISNYKTDISIDGTGTLNIEALSYGIRATRAGEVVIQGDIVLNSKGSVIGIGADYSNNMTIKDNAKVNISVQEDMNNYGLASGNLYVKDNAKVYIDEKHPFISNKDNVEVDSTATLNVIGRKFLSSTGWPHTLYGTVTVPENSTFDLGAIYKKNGPFSATEGSSLINKGTIKLSDGVSVEQIKILNIINNGSLMLGDKKVQLFGDTLYQDQGEITGDIDLKNNMPTVPTYYKKSDGYMLIEPSSGMEKAVVKLHNLKIDSNKIIFPEDELEIILEGKNEISNMEGFLVKNNNKLILKPDSELNLLGEGFLRVEEGALNNLVIEQGAAIINNSDVFLPIATTVEEIKSLNFKGSGVVNVVKEYDNGKPSKCDTYTNLGKSIISIKGDLLLRDTEVTEADNRGYTWVKEEKEDKEVWTLTLKNIFLTGNIDLPNKEVIINTIEESNINGSIQSSTGYSINPVFIGSGLLNIRGSINGAVDNDSITVKDGAKLNLIGNISIGGSGGTGGTVNVLGKNTVLDVKTDMFSALYCDQVNIKDGALLRTKTSNPDGVGIKALSGVSITGGSTLDTGCDYGVYIIGGKLTVDQSSTLITNASVAPFCIVDSTSSKNQSEVLDIPATPSGTKVSSVKGTDVGYGYTYWSVVSENGSLSVSGENSEPATLSGATTGLLKFVKTSSSSGGSSGTSSGGSSGGGSALGNTSQISSSNEAKANLPKVLIDRLVKDETKEFTINIENKRVKFDLESLKSIQSQLDVDATLDIKKSSIEESIKNKNILIGKHPVYEFTITGINKKEISDFGKGKVYIEIPYILEENEVSQNVTAYYIDNKGQLKEISNTVYDEKNKKIIFEINHFSKIGIGNKVIKSDYICPFEDIKNHWAKADIEFVSQRGLFGGTGEKEFSPDTKMTRGMFVTVLGRLAKADVSSYEESQFKDVNKDMYYMKYIEWANKNKIVSGLSEESFGADQPITREQMAVMIVNYIKFAGIELPKTKAKIDFTDDNEISEYAKLAIEEMQKSGLISGKEGNVFDSKGLATRAEVSSVLKRFIEVTEK